MGIIKPYTRAAHSSDLKCDEHHDHTDLLGAMAIKGGLASLLIRLKYGLDENAYKSAYEKLINRARDHQAKWGWREIKNVRRIVKIALTHWLNDVCRYCGGKSYKRMEYVDNLSDNPCEACNGTGKWSVACDPNIRNYVLDVINYIECNVIDGDARASRKIG